MTQDDRDLRHISFEGRPVPPGRYRPASAPVAPRRDSYATPVASAALPAVALDPLSRWVLDRAGLDPYAYRPESLARRVPACLRALKVRSEDEARLLLARRPALLATAISTLLIGVTGFFRDADVFVTLRDGVVPSLAGLGRRVRVWSAACASGAELYGFAILLAEAGLLDRAELVGTDCRSDVIAEAQAAVFDVDDARAMGESLFDRYFERAAGGRCRPIERLRGRVQWRPADFLDDAERGPWDLIFWRNAAIYLNADACALVYRRLTAELSSGGFLVLGRAERPTPEAGLVPVARCVYQGRGA